MTELAKKGENLFGSQNFDHRLIFHRQQLMNDPECRKLALTYSKTELRAIYSFLFVSTTFFFIALVGCFYDTENELHLPIQFYILFLPFEGFSFNWMINYAYQGFLGILDTYTLIVAVVLIMTILNHSCWGLETVVLLIESLKSKLNNDKTMNQEMIETQLKHIFDMSYTIFERKKDVQKLVGFLLMVEFSFMGVVICTCFYSIAIGSQISSFLLVVILFSFVSLFIYCAMGHRVITRIDNLIIAAYDIEWYLLNRKQKGDIQVFMAVAQKMNGFHGIFYPLSMLTFQKVCQLKKVYILYDLSEIFQRCWSFLIQYLHF